MTETFDTFTTRPISYYVLGTLCISAIAFMLIGRAINLNISRVYVLCIVLVEISSVLLLAFLTSTGKSYNKDGELTVTADVITIRSIVITTAEIINLEIKAVNYKGRIGKFPDDGGGNSLTVQTKDATLSCSFIIKSKTQSDNLKQIINLWQASGVSINPLLV